ncbi:MULTISPECIES: iron-containing alcohol dehydrogenase [Halomonas]|uniref:iron-containing alcohol dehydrogenase n=1 Tax=Halomonas TaxID=2745 RepID=UPI001A8FE77A|nr:MULTISPECIES: iron-containing alcohol dehydrogenase [Halomonas]MBN8411635.1 iron-containing alcohol dehydrogenase [Halomonas litopenaei]MBY5923853.1 iron-containing alcohol dehydrogenase [Halomonas sp. DP4Y7-2]MBY5928001.1 iron-containing alcohol dehydrogenase [Halomonas sp. DP8Y7-3]MBY5967451.1 iron-containing alcohol dehydrogenase [Halomonas denitrificans]MBY5982950.1 iron-containing alcohol dehydrogenase [Halomonas sp. DP5Y7-2]
MSDISRFTTSWNYPSSILTGAGRIRDLPQQCHELGMHAPLLVTDPGLAALPMVADALEHCRSEGLRVGLFSEIKGNPTGANVIAGVDAFREGEHDGVIAFGGGSGLDAAKAVALMANQRDGLSLWSLEDIGDNWKNADAKAIVPVVAVPTTAGTGSEVGRASVITDEAEHVKRIIFHPGMVPARVILDPTLTVGLPPAVTAATGMDALSHCLEAWCAPGYHPMAEGIAVEGMRRVRDFLPRAYAHGDDLEARLNMLVASSMGATAFQRGLGAMHALAHPLGALYDAHHGTLNAILMPYVLKANERAIGEPMVRLCRYLDLRQPSTASAIDWVLELRERLAIPHDLAAIGIDDSQADKVAEMAVVDPSAGSNPIAFTAEDYRRVFLAALEGRL